MRVQVAEQRHRTFLLGQGDRLNDPMWHYSAGREAMARGWPPGRGAIGMRRVCPPVGWDAVKGDQAARPSATVGHPRPTGVDVLKEQGAWNKATLKTEIVGT